MDKVVIADDHQVVRNGLKMIIGSMEQYSIVGEAATGDELVEKVFELKPDLVVSDLKMPGISILESSKLLKSRLPELKICVLTAYDDSEDIYRAFESQVDGYLMKDTNPEEILNTLSMILKGYSCFQPKVHPTKPQESESVDLQLTGREQEVFACIVENLSNSEISKKLFITEATVKTHVSSILRKTGQTNRAQAVLYAIKSGAVTV